MDLEFNVSGVKSWFAAFVETITTAHGRSDRVLPLPCSCADPLPPGNCAIGEPMAPRVRPGRGRAAHQSLYHFVAKSNRSDGALLDAVGFRVVQIIDQHSRSVH